MSEVFVIEKGVSIPPKRVDIRPRTTKYPFHVMQVGDSFTVPLGTEKKGTSYVSALRLISAATSHRKRNPGWGFSIRTLPEEGVVRIWRVA